MIISHVRFSCSWKCRDAKLQLLEPTVKCLWRSFNQNITFDATFELKKLVSVTKVQKNIWQSSKFGSREILKKIQNTFGDPKSLLSPLKDQQS